MSDQKPLILIVDDDATNLNVLISALKEDYRTVPAKNGPMAINLSKKKQPELILLDVNMPEMNGYEVCTKIISDPETQHIPIIFITGMDDPQCKIKGFEVGAIDYVTKPFAMTEVMARIKNHITLKRAKEELKDQNTVLEKKVQEKILQLQNTLSDVIKSISLVLECRDPFTANHQKHVAMLSVDIARKIGLPQDRQTAIHHAAFLHDIGKIRIPSEILNRPGRLFDAEVNVIKHHSQVGFEILDNISSPWPLSKIVLQVHERMDGSGYPNQLKGEAILIEARIIAVADVVEAMSAKRPYRDTPGIDKAKIELMKNAGTKYDPKIVDTCIGLINEEDWWKKNILPTDE